MADDDLRTVCADCGQRLRMPNVPGSEVACPGCKAVLPIPTPEEVEAALPVRFAVVPSKPGPGRNVSVEQTASRKQQLEEIDPSAAVELGGQEFHLGESKGTMTPAPPLEDALGGLEVDLGDSEGTMTPAPPLEQIESPPDDPPTARPRIDLGVPRETKAPPAGEPGGPLDFLRADSVRPDDSPLVPEVSEDGTICPLARTILLSNADLKLVAIERLDVVGQRNPNMWWAAVWTPNESAVVLSETFTRDEVRNHAELRGSWDADWPASLESIVARARASSNDWPVPPDLAKLLNEFWTTYSEANSELQRMAAEKAARKRGGSGRMSAQSMLKQSVNKRRFQRCKLLVEQIEQYFRFEDLPAI